MQNTVIKSAVKCILVLGLGVAAIEGCGSSSSSSTDPVALCTQSCEKLQMCLADASVSSTMSTCMANCTKGAGGASGQGTTCKNESQIETAYSNCLKDDCSQILSCISTIPPCDTGSGTGGTGGTSGTGTGGAGGTTGKGGTNGAAGSTGKGGTSGAAGSTGSAGTSGTAADCSICDKAHTCCAAVMGASAATCTALTAASCNALPAANQSTAISACQNLLSLYASQNAACQ